MACSAQRTVIGELRNKIEEIYCDNKNLQDKNAGELYKVISFQLK